MNRYYCSTSDAAKQNEVILMIILIYDNPSDGYLCQEKSGSPCEDVDSDTGKSGG